MILYSRDSGLQATVLPVLVPSLEKTGMVASGWASAMKSLPNQTCR